MRSSKRAAVAARSFGVVSFVARRTVTKELMQALLGSVVHPFMHRREWMCVISRSYRFTSGLLPRMVYKVPADMADEIRGCVCGLLLCSTDLRAPVASEIHATDATPWTAAVTSARVSQELASEFISFSEHKGAYVRLDEGPYGCLFSPWTQTHLPEVYREAIASAPWEISGKVKFKNSSRVNLQEMRGLRKLVRSRRLK